MIDKQKEEEFYAKDFSFSYSSLNKLLFSPTLFYKDYILLEKEVKTEKHLIEGRLVHCLLFEPDKVKDKFNIVPGKTPSDNVRKVLKNMSLHTDATKLSDVEDFIILDSLKELNLYQSLKKDEARIAKIKTEDNEPYWTFLGNSAIDVIDQDTLTKCSEYVDIIQSNNDVMDLFSNESETDFELDPISIHCEQPLYCKLENYSFGLKGIVDFYKIDKEKKVVTICDLKTTSKTIADFQETVDFYNYWLQAAIYSKLVYENLKKNHSEDAEMYQILFKFVVIDKYNQVYVFDVREDTLGIWANGLENTLERANYHYTNKNYTLPYNFLIEKVKL